MSDGRRIADTAGQCSNGVVSTLPTTPTVCNFCDGPMEPLRRNPRRKYWFTQCCTVCGEKLHVFTSPTATYVSVWEKQAIEKKKTVIELAHARMGTRVNEYPAAAPG